VCHNKDMRGNYKHGYFGTTTYRRWANMKDRCDHARSNRNIYFDRNIQYCKKWAKFEEFLKDMGECPPGNSLDRIDNNKGYSKSNCRWATPKEQARNRRSNTLLKHKGKNLTISEWSEITGIKRSTIAQRYYVYGWSVDKALTKK